MRRFLRLVPVLAVPVSLAALLAVAAPAAAAWDETAFPRLLLAYRTGCFQSAEVWRSQQGKTCGNRSPTVHLGIVFVGSIAFRTYGSLLGSDQGNDNNLWALTPAPARSAGMSRAPSATTSATRR
jgi:hypothetical protein